MQWLTCPPDSSLPPTPACVVHLLSPLSLSRANINSSSVESSLSCIARVFNYTMFFLESHLLLETAYLVIFPNEDSFFLRAILCHLILHFLLIILNSVRLFMYTYQHSQTHLISTFLIILDVLSHL